MLCTSPIVYLSMILAREYNSDLGVDDILLIGNDIEFLDSIKGYLNKSFSMKDLGEAAYRLGIKIYRDRSRRLIGLSQST